MQSFEDHENASSAYAKTYEITFFISAMRTGLVRFDEMEKAMKMVLTAYSEKNLAGIPPFDELEPSLENIGKVIYRQVKQNLERIGTSLEKLEISESPIKTYIINEEMAGDKLTVGDKKISISSLIMKNIISQSVSRMVSVFENTGEPLTSQEATEQTVPEEYETVSEPEALNNTELPQEPPEILPAKQEAGEVPPAGKMRMAVWFAFGVCCLIGAGTLIAYYLWYSGAYPAGADIYGHLFKSDFLYHSIRNGDYYPLYTELWYNGIQPYRYWAPLPYYLLAILQYIAGGDALHSYLLFVIFSYAAGGIGWLLFGLSTRRMALCTFLGVIWFLLPDNMRVFFVEGNLPRMTIAILLPYLFFFLWGFVEQRRAWCIVPTILFMCLVTLCHAMIAAMTGVTIFIFLLLYSVNQRRVKESAYAISALLLSFALVGIWLYPALKGGLVGMDANATAEVMEALSTPVLVSLNPILRNAGWHELFYFGLSILALAIIGLVLADKKSRAGFLTVILVFCGTTTAFVPFLEKLPLNQVFWMVRFTPIVYAIFLLALLEWKKCRRYALLVIALILVVDCVPSMDLQKYHSQTPAILKYTLDGAKEITNQRISLLDVSAYGSYPSYGLTAEEPKTPYTFGWAWQAAATANNIVMVNTALERGYYYYMFDRSIELGDDTVLIRKQLVAQAKKSLIALKEAAQASGYDFLGETNFAYVFHKKTPESFGVVSKYQGLAIGRNAKMIALEFPGFEEGGKSNLNEYTAEELCMYKIVYLSGFKYNDREAAEVLLKETADRGVKIILDMNQIPVDPITSKMTIFNVTAQNISFYEQYPELMFRDHIYEARPFSEAYKTWNTVYLENVRHIQGYSWFQNKRLAFIGTGDVRNIYFMGYNFLYHAMETGDEGIMNLMAELLDLEPNQLPERRIVPIDVDYEEDRILIEAPAGETVNTTIAYHDIFQSDQKIMNTNNLLTVTGQKTEIRMEYPYLVQGLALSLAGFLGIVIMLYILNKGRRLSQ